MSNGIIIPLSKRQGILVEKSNRTAGKFFCEIRDEIRQRHSEIIDDYVLDERIRGIENTSLALCEAKVEDEVIVFLLIKYWDLRPSEAKEIFQETKRLLDINR